MYLKVIANLHAVTSVKLLQVLDVAGGLNHTVKRDFVMLRKV